MLAIVPKKVNLCEPKPRSEPKTKSSCCHNTQSLTQRHISAKIVVRYRTPNTLQSRRADHRREPQHHVLETRTFPAVKNHSPDGFNCGYAGSVPAQLALAILLEVTNDEAKALAHYQDFKFQLIAAITSQTTNWEIEEQKIIAWIEMQDTKSI